MLRLHQNMSPGYKLYLRVSLVADYMYPVSATKLSLTQHYGDMYPLVSRYKLLIRDTCIRLHVSWCKRGLRERLHENSDAAGFEGYTLLHSVQ